MNRHKRSLQTPSGVGSVAWSPDGTTLAVGSLGGRLLLVEMSTKEPRTLTWTSNQALIALSWSQDSKAIATASDDSVVHLWDASKSSHRDSIEKTKGRSSPRWGGG